jgi:hypothetical protein
LNYHLAEGWVSAIIRGSTIMNLSPPQVVVVDITKKRSTRRSFRFQDPLFLPRSSADQPISPSLPSAVSFFLEFFDCLFPEKKSTKLFSMSEYLREQEQQTNSSSSALARQFPDSSSFIDHFIAKEFVVPSPAIPGTSFFNEMPIGMSYLRSFPIGDL